MIFSTCPASVLYITHRESLMLAQHTRERILAILHEDGAGAIVKALLANPLNPDAISGMERVVVRVAQGIDAPYGDVIAYIFNVLPTL